jgi:hypothetical protein
MDAFPKDIQDYSGAELEYVSLREEALRRTESRQNLLSVTLTLAAAFCGIGWGTGGSVALMIFPPIATLLALAWVQNEIAINRINTYIRDELAPKIPGLSWERYARERMMSSRIGAFPLDMLAIAGVFVMAQLLAVVLAFFQFQIRSVVEWFLLALDIVSIAALIFMVEYLRRVITR